MWPHSLKAAPWLTAHRGGHLKGTATGGGMGLPSQSVLMIVSCPSPGPLVPERLYLGTSSAVTPVPGAPGLHRQTCTCPHLLMAPTGPVTLKTLLLQLPSGCRASRARGRCVLHVVRVNIPRFPQRVIFKEQSTQGPQMLVYPPSDAHTLISVFGGKCPTSLGRHGGFLS